MGKKSKRKTKTKSPVVVDDVTITSDEALFKDPPAKEDCPICFLPMPVKMICCASLPDATSSSVPIADFAIANERLAAKHTENYYPCCGKSICKGCVVSFYETGNKDKCPFCNAEISLFRTDEEKIADIIKRVEANDPGAICELACCYYCGRGGVQQDRAKSRELHMKAADLGSSMAHYLLAGNYYDGGDLKKSNFHYEAAAMAGHELARSFVGTLEYNSGNVERAVKHWTIAASAGEYTAMQNLITLFEDNVVSRESIDTTLTAYNSSCAEMRSEARDASIRLSI
jgi:TPR repeat protein